MTANPVIRGFAPDPSIVRVNGTFYVANSSFEWFPRIPIHSSTDLVNWKFAGCLNGPDVELSLTGIPDSGGIWAPSLSFDSGRFWLVYSVIYGMGGGAKELRTYVTTSESVAGPWHRPARVPGHGFDPSIFHHNGNTWLINMQWDHRPGRDSFAGITLQELDFEGSSVVGAPTLIHQRETLIEGPNLYFRDGWFYLLLAEGGTGANHGIAMMRSRRMTGPYEPDPQPALLTTRDDPSHPLQKAGHGELVETADGRWFLVHLASRWLNTDNGPQSMLGRETCLQEVRWNDDGWLRLREGGWHPHLVLATLPPVEAETQDEDVASLRWPWSSLRCSLSEEWADVSSRPGWLRLTGADSPDSLFEQSLVARRLTEHNISVSVTVDAAPKSYTQSAGLIFYYNTSAWIYLQVTWSEPNGCEQRGQQWSGAGVKVLRVLRRDGGSLAYLGSAVVVPDGEVRLHATLTEGELQFSWSTEELAATDIGPATDATILSDDHGGRLRFTGSFVGIRAEDSVGEGFTADFSDFVYTTAHQ